MIGLRRGSVQLCPHDPEWEKEARRTMEILQRILGKAVKDIAHVGSTAVSAIAAKPIIDIAVATDDFESVIMRNDELRKNGFYYRCGINSDGDQVRGDLDLSKEDIVQLLYACGGYYDGTDMMQTHFIHVVGTGSKEWTDYIKFRDVLNENPALAKEYEHLKVLLSRSFADKREKYTARKREFITRVLNSF